MKLFSLLHFSFFNASEILEILNHAPAFAIFHDIFFEKNVSSYFVPALFCCYGCCCFTRLSSHYVLCKFGSTERAECNYRSGASRQRQRTQFSCIKLLYISFKLTLLAPCIIFYFLFQHPHRSHRDRKIYLNYNIDSDFFFYSLLLCLIACLAAMS